MKSVLRIVLLLGVMLLVTSGLIQAQDPAQTFCGELSAADCALMTNSEAVMKDLDSHSFKLDMTVGVSGIPDMPADKLSFHLTGSGALAVDQKAMPDMSKLDPATLAKDQTAIFNLIAKAIPYLSADLQFSLEIPPELLKSMGDAKLPETVKLSLRLVDGDIYVKMADLAAFMPQTNDAPEWLGINLPDMVKAILKQPGFSDSMGSMTAGMGMGSNIAETLSKPETLKGFIKIERLADATVNARQVAVFKTTLDYPAMFELPFMQDMIAQQMKASGSKMSEKEMAAVMDMIKGMAKGMQFSSTQSIDLQSKYVHRTDIDMVLDFSSMKEMTGTAMVFSLSAKMTQGDFNSVPAITAPEGGVVIPVESIVPLK